MISKEENEKYQKLFSEISNIFFEDDLSNEIFVDRHEWNISGNRDPFFAKTIKLLHKEIKVTLPEIVEKNKNKKLVIYGCGNTALEICQLFTYMGKTFDYFYVDKEYERPESFYNLEFIDLSKIKETPNDYTIVLGCCLEHLYNKMRNKLFNISVPNELIIDLNFDLGTQYFDKEILNLSDNEIFVDGGAFDGISSLDFLKFTDYKYEKIILLEPDTNYLNICKDKLYKYDNIQYIKGGLWSTNKTLYFNSVGLGNSFVAETGTEKIDVYALDELVDEKGATFIKMDIEGSELEALKGCEKTILNHKPTLAISIYHKPEDIYDIPLYLKKLVPEYKFYIRHYGIAMLETILYAII